MKQIFQNPRIMHIRRCCRDRVNHLRLAVDTNVCLHSEIPLLALAGLVHLGIALLILVLGRTRRVDDRGIDNGSTRHLHAILFQVDIHYPEQLITEVVAFHQMTKLADRGLVRHRFPAQINAHELTHGSGIVQRFLGTRIR